MHWDPQQMGAVPVGTNPERVMVLAIPCLGDNLPADKRLAAVRTYEVAADGHTTAATAMATGFDRDQLVRAACTATT